MLYWFGCLFGWKATLTGRRHEQISTACLYSAIDTTLIFFGDPPLRHDSTEPERTKTHKNGWPNSTGATTKDLARKSLDIKGYTQAFPQVWITT